MALKIALWLLVVLASLHSTSSLGSDRHLKEIVLGRCWDFQRQKVYAVNAKNCSQLWETFSKAFAYKDPCATNFSDYEPFFDEVGMDIVKMNKSLFWSGTYKEAHMYSDFDFRLTTLEDTMAGWMMNNLTWCGSQNKSSDGINYTSCPSCDDWPFWGLASKRFAEKANGIVRVLVNGSRSINGTPAAYSKKSFFGRLELPNLNKSKVIKLLILVVHNIGGPVLEVCGNGSIKEMENDAKKRGIQTTCHDNPAEIQHLLCADFPNSRECQFLASGARNATKSVSCGLLTY
ncbi:ADP-ribosyl cyclase/cyclic ADP-ribose hydrolase-like isoform X2 [Stylophora pistillata]|uniref:ADP-ribosyl cyclase/cyclic ADP-ribose hydrolase-like isoform X2 n=1 Tax=Stylophora pistillata TaxID=50429 RepID=UPI000C04BAE8|nr:ADP-ribosyl cyclase/cyclic ADP-ribose hydrolase-like isoform X2 [Stylophora pistillata]